MLKPKVGDMVRLKPLLVERVEPGWCCDVLVAGGITLNRECVEEILPRPLRVGDRVRYLAGVAAQAPIFTILAIDGEDVWMKWSSGEKSDARLSELRHA